MKLSFMTINRIVETEAAKNETYRRQLLQNGKLTLATGRALSDEELLARLASLGLPTTRDEFLRRTTHYLSAEEMAQAVYANTSLSIQPKEEDWVWIAFTCLWERWSPDRPSLEMIDDWMQEGYDCHLRREPVAASRLWLKTWKSVWANMESRYIRSVKEYDRQYPGTNSLFNWLQDLSQELYTASLQEEWFLQERLALLQTLLERIDVGDLRRHFQSDLGGTYFALNRPELADQIYSQWLADNPRWGCGWVTWSDGYQFELPEPMRDLAKAEQILKRGLAVPDVEDRAFILDRLLELSKEAGRDEEAKAVEAEIDRLTSQRPAPVSRNEEPPRLKLPKTSGPSLEGAALRRSESPMLIQPSTPQVGRNDPCPCGSGKKFKKCCGQR